MVVAKNRKPTGKPSWPRILLSGEEGARKSWVAAELSADERIGGMFWLEVGDGEVTADEYGAITDVDYDIIVHDGTWLDIYEQLCAHWQIAKKAELAGELRIALTVDAMSGIHSMLYDMADTRARRKLADQLKKQGENPDLAWSSEREIAITPDLHNLVKKRHQQFMSKVHNWPGPVVLISRERIATVFDDNGNPTKKKDWTLECRKDLPSQCTAHVRLTRGNPPLVRKLRSVRHGIMPEKDAAVARKDFTCARLIFDWVGCEPRVSRAPESRELNADQVMPDEAPAATAEAAAAEEAEHVASQILKAAKAATTEAAFMKHWNDANRRRLMGHIVEGEALEQLLRAEAARIKPAETAGQPASETTLQKLNIAANKHVRNDRIQRLAVLSELAGRRLTSSSELREGEAARIAKELAAESADALVFELLSNPQVMAEAAVA